MWEAPMRKTMNTASGQMPINKNQSNLLTSMQSFTRFNQLGSRDFVAKVPIHIISGKLIVRTVNSSWELAQVSRLRYNVFQREYAGNAFSFGSDWDRYDPFSDLLVVSNRETGQAVGTYRLICSLYSSEFYSASEFNIDAFLAIPGVKLELSRSCVHKDYRNGSVIALLWKGVAEYFKATGASHLFGCSSIKTVAKNEIFRVYRYLKDQGRLKDGFGIMAKDPYRIEQFEREYRRFHSRQGSNTPMNPKLPGLLRAYLKAGARFLGDPAIDMAFKCTDFFTVLELNELTDSYQRKFVR